MGNQRTDGAPARRPALLAWTRSRTALGGLRLGQLCAHCPSGLHREENSPCVYESQTFPGPPTTADLGRSQTAVSLYPGPTSGLHWGPAFR